LPKPPFHPAPLWPVKKIDAQYYILDLEDFELNNCCVMLEREGREPEILPVKTLEEAELLVLRDFSYKIELENIPYKIYQSTKIPFRLFSEETKEAIRQGLNYYQVRQMKREPIRCLSYSSLSFPSHSRIWPPLKGNPQNDYLCFPYGEHKEVRANFHVQGKDLKEALMQIIGFKEILSLSS
jgi:hypothetical protein